jgi:outer membrane protein assembly factor BamE (lipoprotein component of BamABCDE complex)
MKLLYSALLAALLAACAHPTNGWNVAPGTPQDQVIATMGRPSAVVPLAGGGQRLQYSMQPLGHYAFMVDLDASGKVVQSRQVMTPAEFHRIEPGKWTRDDVLREFGRPAWVDGVSSFQGSVWTYRWLENNNPMFYWVYLEPKGVVQRAHPGMEYINFPNERR